MGHKRQYLQNQICNKRPHEILSLSSVQKRHINYNDIDTFFLSQDPPLILNFLIVSSKPINTEDIEKITFLEFSDQTLIARPDKVLARLLIHKDIGLRNAH